MWRQLYAILNGKPLKEDGTVQEPEQDPTPEEAAEKAWLKYKDRN